MATESQFDSWRKDVLSNVGKAIKAASNPQGEMAPDDRVRISLAFAEVSSNLLVSERIGQLSRLLSNPESELGKAQERTRTGEQLLQGLVKAAELDENDMGEELQSFLTMAEDWLDPDSMVRFSSPEAVEEGRDLLSQDSEEEPEEDPGPEPDCNPDADED